MKSLARQIEDTSRELARTPLRSHRRVILFVRLRELILKQLRKEIRQERRAA
jgi:hypothetical protein